MTEAPAQVIFVPGLYINLPGVSDHNKRMTAERTTAALQSALGDLAVVHAFDANYHGEGTPQEKLNELYEHVWDTAHQAGEPVHVAGASLGGNLAFGAAVRLGPKVVARGLAVSAPLRAKKSPPWFLKLKDGDDMKFVTHIGEQLDAASPAALSRLTSLYGAKDFMVKPELSQWQGVNYLPVPGYLHPRIILRTLANRELMRNILLDPRPSE